MARLTTEEKLLQIKASMRFIMPDGTDLGDKYVDVINNKEGKPVGVVLKFPKEDYSVKEADQLGKTLAALSIGQPFDGGLKKWYSEDGNTVLGRKFVIPNLSRVAPQEALDAFAQAHSAIRVRIDAKHRNEFLQEEYIKRKTEKAPEVELAAEEKPKAPVVAESNVASAATKTVTPVSTPAPAPITQQPTLAPPLPDAPTQNWSYDSTKAQEKKLMLELNAALKTEDLKRIHDARKAAGDFFDAQGNIDGKINNGEREKFIAAYEAATKDVKDALSVDEARKKWLEADKKWNDSLKDKSPDEKIASAKQFPDFADTDRNAKVDQSASAFKGLEDAVNAALEGLRRVSTEVVNLAVTDPAQANVTGNKGATEKVTKRF